MDGTHDCNIPPLSGTATHSIRFFVREHSYHGFVREEGRLPALEEGHPALLQHILAFQRHGNLNLIGQLPGQLNEPKEQVVALNLPESLLSLRTGSTVYSETLTTHPPTPYCDYGRRATLRIHV